MKKVLSTICNYCKQNPVSDIFWRKIIHHSSLSHHSNSEHCFWLLLAVFGRFWLVWPFLAVFGSFWQKTTENAKRRHRFDRNAKTNKRSKSGPDRSVGSAGRAVLLIFCFLGNAVRNRPRDFGVSN